MPRPTHPLTVAGNADGGRYPLRLALENTNSPEPKPGADCERWLPLTDHHLNPNRDQFPNSGRVSSVTVDPWALVKAIQAIASQLTPTEQLVLRVLTDYADNRTWQCWPSQRRVADGTGLALSSVKRIMKALEAAGHLSRERRYRGGYRTSDLIRLHPGGTPPPSAAEPGDLGSHCETQAAGSDLIHVGPRSDSEPAELPRELSRERARAVEPQQDPTPAPEPAPAAPAAAPDRLVAAARPLIRARDRGLRPGEIADTVGQLVTDDGHPRDVVLAAIERLAAEGVRVDWPRQLRDRLRADLGSTSWHAGRRRRGSCGTCGDMGTVPAEQDPSKRARCPACTGRDAPPVPAVGLPAEPAVKPEVPQGTAPDPWAADPDPGPDPDPEPAPEDPEDGDASPGRVAAGPWLAREAIRAACQAPPDPDADPEDGSEAPSPSSWRVGGALR